jgi:hypothetical protein
MAGIDFDNHPIVKHTRFPAAALRMWHANPEQFVIDVFNTTPEDYQNEFMSILQPNFGRDRIAFKSAHGTGKSTSHAWTGWDFLITRPYSRIAATAPTKAQLTDVLWPEYSKWHQKMPEELRDLFDITEGHIRCKIAPKTWFAVARTSNRPANLQGFHGKHILIQVDEASAVQGEVFEVIEGALSNAELDDDEVLLALTGNPNFTSGEFFDAFGKNSQLYHRVSVSGDPDTKFTSNCGKTFISRRVTPTYRKRMGLKYGTKSPVYDVRVRGLFPRMDDWAMIPLEFAERAQYVPLPEFDKAAHQLRYVMDVARQGGNKTTLGRFRGNHLISIKGWAKTSAEQCVDILIDAQKTDEARGLHVSEVVIDEPGIGGGVIDILQRREFPATVIPYNGGAALIKGVDPEEDCRMFHNRRARDWWHARRLLEVGLVHIPTDKEGETTIYSELVAELASLRYRFAKVTDKIVGESKQDYGDRLGGNVSPDLADTVIMGLAPTHHLSTLALSGILVGLGDVTVGEDRPTAEIRADINGLY